MHASGNTWESDTATHGIHTIVITGCWSSCHCRQCKLVCLIDMLSDTLHVLYLILRVTLFDQSLFNNRRYSTNYCICSFEAKVLTRVRDQTWEAYILYSRPYQTQMMCDMLCMQSIWWVGAWGRNTQLMLRTSNTWLAWFLADKRWWWWCAISQGTMVRWSNGSYVGGVHLQQQWSSAPWKYWLEKYQWGTQRVKGILCETIYATRNTSWLIQGDRNTYTKHYQ